MKTRTISLKRKALAIRDSLIRLCSDRYTVEELSLVFKIEERVIKRVTHTE